MSGWEAMQQGAPDPFFAEGRNQNEFVGDDNCVWRVVRFPSAACGPNYADVVRADGTKRSVRQAELLRRVGIALPEASEWSA
jgi:hypothetical protein